MITKTKADNSYYYNGYPHTTNTFDWKCLSTDTKPTTGVTTNDLLLELDTGDFYYFTGEAWAKVGG